jgi:hypothetical protein
MPRRTIGMRPGLMWRRNVSALTPKSLTSSAASSIRTRGRGSLKGRCPHPDPGQSRLAKPRRRPGGQGPRPAGGRVASAACQPQPEGIAPGWASADSPKLGIGDRSSRSALISIIMPMASKSQSKNLAIFDHYLGSNACGFLMEACDPRKISSPPRGQIYRGRAPWA